MTCPWRLSDNVRRFVSICFLPRKVDGTLSTNSGLKKRLLFVDNENGNSGRREAGASTAAAGV